MKKNKQPLLLSLLLLLLLPGCYSLKVIPADNPSEIVGKPLIIHSSDSSFKVNYSGSTEVSVTGTIDSSSVKMKSKKYIHLYLASDTSISRNGNLVTIPFSGIAKIEKYNLKYLRTTVFITSAAFLTSIAIGFLSIILGGGYDM